MNNILSEKEYQRYIIDQLVKPECGYVEAPGAEFDRLFAMNHKALLAFIEATQPEKLQALRKIYKEKTEDTLVAFINQQETRANGSRLDVLKHGVGQHSSGFDVYEACNDLQQGTQRFVP